MSYIVMVNHLHLLINIQNEDSAKDISLPDIIKEMKAKVYLDFSRRPDSTKLIQSIKIIWQRSYWDHIVRKSEDLVSIDEYIKRNPEFWNMDTDNPDDSNPIN